MVRFRDENLLIGFTADHYGVVLEFDALAHFMQRGFPARGRDTTLHTVCPFPDRNAETFGQSRWRTSQPDQSRHFPRWYHGTCYPWFVGCVWYTQNSCFRKVVSTGL